MSIKTILKSIFKGIGISLLVIISSFTVALLFGKDGNQSATIFLVLITVWIISILIFVKFKKRKRNHNISQISPQIKDNRQSDTSEFDINYNSDIKYTRNDNYATAAFLKWSEYGKAVGNEKSDYPYYFQSTFKILDPVKYHKKLIAMGYLEPADISMSLKCLKVNELKEILKNNNIRANGKKDDLINAITSNVNCDLLNLKKFFIPSKIGIAHLNKYEYVFRLNNYGISIEFFDSLLAKSDSKTSPNKIIWDYLSSEFAKYYDGKAYDLAGDQLYKISKLFYDQKKFEMSTFFLVSYFYFCLYEYAHDENRYTGHLDSIIGTLFDFKSYYQSYFAYECCKQYKALNNPISPDMLDKLIKDIFNDIPIDFNQYLESS